MTDHWFTQTEIMTVLNQFEGFSYHCFSYQFPGNSGYTPCISIIERGRVTVGHTEPTQYATPHEALSAAYRVAAQMANVFRVATIRRDIITYPDVVGTPGFSEE